ncbi:MAG: hypothetical protein ACPLKX_09040 [Dictyoglomaceae bacterium]
MKDFNFGAFYLKNQVEKKEEWALYLNYSLRDDIQFNFNYLVKRLFGELDQEKDIWSMGIKVSSLKNINFEMEYAQGIKNMYDGKALRILASGNYKEIEANYNLIYAEPNYPGSYNDTFYQNFSLNLPILNNVKIWEKYSEKIKNLSLDPSSGDSAEEKTKEIGISYKLKDIGVFSFSYLNFLRKDRFYPPKIDFNESYVVLGFESGINNLTFDVSYKIGEKKDNLNISLKYTPSSNQRYSLNYSGDFSKSVSIDKTRKDVISFNMWHMIDVSKYVNFSFSSTYLDFIKIFNYLSLYFTYKFSPSQFLELRGSYSFSNNNL